MVELRKDYLTGEWVAISTVRAERPYDFGGYIHRCPFCSENADMTPGLVYKSENVRVIPNKYPALESGSAQGYGHHEVLIDTCSHEERLHEFSQEHLAEIFTAIQSRMRAISADEKIKYVQVFKNQGLRAGASLSHSHWQILGISVLPSKQRNINANFENYFKEHGSCYLCDLQKMSGELLVFENAAAIAYVTEASPYSDCVSIMPKEHMQDFSELSKEQVAGFSEVFQKIMVALNTLYPGGDYNVCLQNGVGESGHFYLQVIPRMGSFAGFELGTGCFINSIEPHITAKNFREVIL